MFSRRHVRWLQAAHSTPPVGLVVHERIEEKEEEEEQEEEVMTPLEGLGSAWRAFKFFLFFFFTHLLKKNRNACLLTRAFTHRVRSSCRVFFLSSRRHYVIRWEPIKKGARTGFGALKAAAQVINIPRAIRALGGLRGRAFREGGGWSQKPHITRPPDL